MLMSCWVAIFKKFLSLKRIEKKKILKARNSFSISFELWYASQRLLQESNVILNGG